MDSVGVGRNNKEIRWLGWIPFEEHDPASVTLDKEVLLQARDEVEIEIFKVDATSKPNTQTMNHSTLVYDCY